MNEEEMLSFSKNENEYNLGTENLDGTRRNRKKAKIIYGPPTQRSRPTHCENLLPWFHLSRLYCVTTSFLPSPLCLEHIPPSTSTCRSKFLSKPCPHVHKRSHSGDQNVHCILILHSIVFQGWFATRLCIIHYSMPAAG